MILFHRIFIYLIFILLEFLFCQNFRYDSEDWYILTSPGSINAISEDHFNIYFCTDNGIFKYDKTLEDFKYDYLFSVQSDFHQVRHLIYDEYRDYFWVVHSKGISYKSSVSSIWREVSLSSFNIFNFSEIDDMGFSSKFIWIRSMDALYPLDPFTAELVNWEEAEGDIDFIRWGHSKFGVAGESIDISSFSIDGEWVVGINEITHKDGRTLYPSIFMEDAEGNQWFGTDEGFILKGWRYSTRLELITIGLPFNHVTTSYFDSDGNWWFADSKFRRTGEFSNFQNMFQRMNEPFIAQWKELDNNWTYYTSKESSVIQNTDVNAILRVGSIIYFGTMSGLLYLDLFNNDWNVINAMNGLYDDAIWDIMEHDKSIFLATTNGINEVSIINHEIIPNQSKHFQLLTKMEIYDMASDSEFCYLATDSGLFKMDWQGKILVNISQKKFKKIRLNGNDIFAMDDDLWIFNEDGEEKHVVFDIHDFDICASYAWISKKNKVELLDLKTNWDWEYGQADGILGNKIYGVECDEEWVWFLTNKGVVFYKWGEYHHQNK